MKWILAGFLLAAPPSVTSLKLKGPPTPPCDACANRTYEELLWSGEDISVEDNNTAALFGTRSNQSQTAAATRRIQILGQFNTGTNLMYGLLQRNFPGHIGSDGQIWKHASLRRLFKRQPHWREIFRRDRTVAVVVVRDPLSWLQSMRKAPYNMKSCVSQYNWLTAVCPLNVPTWNLWHPGGITFSNIEQYWNENTNDYGHLQDYGFSKSIVVRYEDIVMDTAGVMSNVAEVLGLNFRRPVRHVHAPAKDSGHPCGRAEAIHKLKSKSYLALYLSGQRKQACKRLDVELMRQRGYHGCDGHV